MDRPKDLRSIIDGVARDAVGRDWSLYAALLDHWPEIVGEPFAKLCSPVKLVFPPQRSLKDPAGNPLPPSREGGTLHIKLPRGLMMEFSFLGEQIKERIAAFLGRSSIQKIVLVPDLDRVSSQETLEEITLTNEEKKDLDTSLQNVEQEGIRQALASLGEAILKDKKRKRSF